MYVVASSWVNWSICSVPSSNWMIRSSSSMSNIGNLQCNKIFKILFHITKPFCDDNQHGVSGMTDYKPQPRSWLDTLVCSISNHYKMKIQDGLIQHQKVGQGHNDQSHPRPWSAGLRCLISTPYFKWVHELSYVNRKYKLVFFDIRN